MMHQSTAGSHYAGTIGSPAHTVEPAGRAA